MTRPTINDISRIAGISPAAVSFALNNRPGVSEATRARVKKIADQLGWTPSAAALALSSGRTHTIGLVLRHPSTFYACQRYHMNLIAGIEQVLTKHRMSLMLQVVSDDADELAAYKRWHSSSRVDGIVLTDPRVADPRPDLPPVDR